MQTFYFSLFRKETKKPIEKSENRGSAEGIRGPARQRAVPFSSGKKKSNGQLKREREKAYPFTEKKEEKAKASLASLFCMAIDGPILTTEKRTIFETPVPPERPGRVVF